MDAILGEIRPFGFGFAPRGWMLCNGAELPIRSYTALFSIIGTYYGGNGTTTFKLPNIQGSVLVGTGQLAGGEDYQVGDVGGSSTVQLITQEMPAHSHAFNCATVTGNVGETNAPAANASYLSNLIAKTSAGATNIGRAYGHTPPAVNTALAIGSVSQAGSGLPHENMAPYVVINYCIAIEGEFPQRP
jgi:microcystin-dependent protein